MTTLVLGLDVQLTRVGHGLCRATDGAPWDCGCCESLSRTNPGDHLRQLFVDIDWLNRPNQIIVVYIESPHVGPSRRDSLAHAMVIGRAAQQAERTWPDAAVELIAPQEWKKLVGLPGNAQKLQVATWAHAYGFEHTSQDALDAAAVAVAGQIRNAEIVRVASA